MKGTREDAQAYGYEVAMLLESLNFALENRVQPFASLKEMARANVYLEAFLVHVRNLIEFFLTPKPKRKDDILATDFLGSDWAPTGEHVDRLSRQAQVIPKRLSHLTRSRHGDFDGYEVLDIAVDLVRLHIEFQRQFAVGRPVTSEWFRKATKTIEEFPSDFLRTYLRAKCGPITEIVDLRTQ